MKITKEAVIPGLKYIAENRHKSYQKLVKGLRKLVIFTWEDYDRQFSNEEPMLLTEGMECGDLTTGACILLNILDEYCSWEFVNYSYLSSDSSTSVYNLIGLYTGDGSYKKEPEGIVRRRKKRSN